MRHEDYDDSGAVIGVLDRVVSRALVRHVLEGLAVAAVCLVLVLLALRALRIDIRYGAAWAPLVAVGIVAGSLLLRRRERTRRAAARMVERDCVLHNVVVTAEELQRRPGHGPNWVRVRVFRDAATRLRNVDPSRIVPLKRPIAVAAMTIAGLIAAHVFLPDDLESRALAPQRHAASPADPDRTIRVELHPPAYSGQPPRTLLNPSHLEVLEGTRARVTIATASVPVVRVGQRVLPGSQSPRGTSAETELLESSYLAIEMLDPGGGGNRTTLIPVAVTPDVLPSVRIEAPARDLLLPAPTPTVEVRAVATDDLALAEMSLRYTKVSGSGEQFEFVEGELPIRITRDSGTNWKAAGEIGLAQLGLAPGDSLVYRVTARDKRPGTAGAASSDTFFIEIAGPGQMTFEGFDLPPDRERYALSQQMVVFKIQRLRAREPKLSSVTVQEEAAGIAAEQRAVRANVVFLMGGHVEDEEEEAEHATDIQEGRLENDAWREMSRAIAHMTTAEQGLIAVKTADALAAAQLAVESLQRAFGRSRYFLRAVPSRSRIDPSRRLSGRLDEARGAEREAITGIDEGEPRTSQAVLADVLDLASAVRQQRPDPQVAARLTRVAERALAIKAVGTEWQNIVRGLVEARDLAVRDPNSSAFRQRLDESIRALLAQSRASALRVQARQNGPAHLRGVWSAESRR